MPLSLKFKYDKSLPSKTVISQYLLINKIEYKESHHYLLLTIISLLLSITITRCVSEKVEESKFKVTNSLNSESSFSMNQKRKVMNDL